MADRLQGRARGSACRACAATLFLMRLCRFWLASFLLWYAAWMVRGWWHPVWVRHQSDQPWPSESMSHLIQAERQHAHTWPRWLAAGAGSLHWQGSAGQAAEGWQLPHEGLHRAPTRSLGQLASLNVLLNVPVQLKRAFAAAAAGRADERLNPKPHLVCIPGCRNESPMVSRHRILKTHCASAEHSLRHAFVTCH